MLPIGAGNVQGTRTPGVNAFPPTEGRKAANQPSGALKVRKRDRFGQLENMNGNCVDDDE